MPTSPSLSDPACAARPAHEPAATHIVRGSPTFWRAVVALFASGFSTFSLLYYVQPLLPMFAQDFHVSPAASSLTLSLTTALLAVSMLLASVLSERLGRRTLMVASLVSSAALTMFIACIPNWSVLLVARALMGVTLSGLPAVAMAYVGEEMEPRATGLAMGLYIGGSAIGGMSGRVLAGLIADGYGWQMGALAIGLIGFVNAGLFWKLLPASRNFQSRRLNVSAALAGFRAQWGNPLLKRLFIQAFTIMGAFVAVYNYIGFRLLAPPFSLSQAVVGMVSVVYVAGIASPPWMGDLASRLGYGRVMWAGVAMELAGVLLTLSSSLWLVVLGLAIMTFGFFGAHSICSSWVARAATQGRAQASSLYLFCYYCGSSLIGLLGGYALAHAGWHGFIAMVSLLLVLALANAAIIAKRAAAPAR